MNSVQRRKAYRAMPKPGTVVTYRSRTGAIRFQARVLGTTDAVIMLASTHDDYSYGGFAPSVHRVRLQPISDAGTWTLSPLMKRIAVARGAA